MTHEDASNAFELARSVATFSDYKKTHLGCVVVYKGQTVASGYNQNKTHPIQMKYNRKNRKVNNGNTEMLPKLHAEMSAIVELRKITDVDFSKCDLFVYRICRNREFGMARPCPACMQAIKDIGIKKIHYTTDFGYGTETIK